MASKQPAQFEDDKATKQGASRPDRTIFDKLHKGLAPAGVIQRARLNTRSWSLQEVLQLQAAGSNRAICQLLALAQQDTPQDSRQPSLQNQSCTAETTASKGIIQTESTGGESAIFNQGKGQGTTQQSGMPESLKAGLETLSGMDLSGVRVHNNSARPEQINASAYTQGQDIYLAAGKEKHLPHEGWHAVQQMQGRVTPTLQARGVSINDDSGLEREADVMGARAVALSQSAQTRTTANRPAAKATGSGTVQRYVTYTESDQSSGRSLGWKHPDDDYLKVAEDGEIAIGDYQEAWATDARRNASENVLEKNYSQVKLIKGGRSIKGKRPSTDTGAGVGSGPDITLFEVKATNRDGGGRADLTADCGTAARQILGLSSRADKFSALVKPGGVPTLTTPETYHGGHYTTPDVFADEIFKMHFGAHLSAATARAMYRALPDHDPVAFDKDDFDRLYGINKYAVPELGQAITANEPDGWNFHFAGVFLKSSEDYITGENWPAFLRGDQSWYFAIYGPRSKSQTFHDKWRAPGGRTTTMVVDVREEDRPVIMLKKAIRFENGEYIIKALNQIIASPMPLKDAVNSADVGLMRMLYATDDDHINAVLTLLKTHYLPALTAAERTALVLKGAKGYTFERETNLIKSIMEVSTTGEYVDTIKAVEKEVSSESDDIIVDSLTDASGKLVLSRVPSNLTVKQAMVLIRSLISGACVGDDERAVYLIAQSLAPAVFRNTLNKLTLDYIDSGLDGRQWDEFLVLAAGRYSAGKNVAALRIATENNDDAARLLVASGGIKDKLSYTEWIGIINALLSGSCGDEDEQAIIKIVQWFAADGQLGLINAYIGEDKMDSGVDGEEWDIIVGIMKGGGYDW